MALPHIMNIVITGTPNWSFLLVPLHPSIGRYLLTQSFEGYVDALIEQHASLIIVDDEYSEHEWKQWVHAPKSNPATRRIPVILLTDEPHIAQNAHKDGIDFVYTRHEFTKDPLPILKKHAHILEPEVQQTIANECQETLPERAAEAIELFNKGEYYTQHDLFEAEWAESTRPVRDLYRAILQVGVAYYQIERGNYRGAIKMLQRSAQWFHILPDECQSVNVAQLREDAFAVLKELQRLGEAGFHEFDKSLIKPVQRV